MLKMVFVNLVGYLYRLFHNPKVTHLDDRRRELIQWDCICNRDKLNMCIDAGLYNYI